MKTLLLASFLIVIGGCVAKPHVVDLGPEQEAPPGDWEWPALSDARIRPGTSLAGGCTSNFLFRSLDNSTLYLGTAAHCVDGMLLGEEVDITGASEPGRLAYSSRLARNLTDCSGSLTAQQPYDFACRDDFALVAIDEKDRPYVHPAVLYFGGPTSLGNSSRLDRGDLVVTYGQSTYHQAAEEAKHMRGAVSAVTGDQTWGSFRIFTAPGAVWGDSGAGIMGTEGDALGLILGAIAPAAGDAGAYGLQVALRYADEVGNMTVELCTWPRLAEI